VNIERMRIGWCVLPAIVLGVGAVSGCSSPAKADPPPAIVVNECSTGPGGWIELLNRGSEVVDLNADPSLCWFVDDAMGGGSPKQVGDGNVNHAPGATTCNALGRPPTCAAIGPGEAVWVRYAFLNSSSPDVCRLLTVPKIGSGSAPGGAGGVCVGGLRDPGLGGATLSTTAGQCFGRQPDGASWSTGPITCTPGGPNAKCVANAACDDGNPCTRGETFSATCECTGGTPLNGAPCGLGRICQVGTCMPAQAGAGAVVLGQGTRGLLLTGTLVTPDDVIDGELLMVGDEIKCVGPTCESDPAVATASIVQTNGIIFPGLIDAYDRIQMGAFDETDWAPDPNDRLMNHTQWADNKRYRALVEAVQNLTGEAKGAKSNISCELAKFGKLKGLIAGVTSVVGSPTPEDKKCYGALSRTIDQRPNGVSGDKVRVANPVPKSTADADRICASQENGRVEAYLIPLANGTDEISRNEFPRLFDASTVDGCLFSPKTAVVYGASLLDQDFALMAARGMSLVWTPKSNVFFYGHGTDLARTANIPAAVERGITVALGTDSSVGGSQNLLDELRFADLVDNSQWGDILTPKALVQMVTKNAARILGLRTQLGELALGHKADVVVIGGDRSRPYDALLAATPHDVRLVIVGGKPLYGDLTLKALAESPRDCDALDICTARKFACIAQPGGTSSDLLGQHYEDLRGRLLVELQKFDERKLSDWKFSPPAELCKCGP
jgi:hypothetical protein